MRILKIMLTMLVTGMLAAPLLGCSSESDEAELPEYQAATVQRGDITIDITAAGNLALSRTEDLAIDLFYQEGTIAEVLVEEGDTVAEEQVLVKLDADEWNDELSSLEDQVTTKERTLVQAQVNLMTSEQNLKNARDNEAVKEMAVLNAQISREQAQNNLNTGIAATDYQAAEAELNKARTWYEYIQKNPSADADDWILALERARESLDAAQIQYDNILAGYDSNEVAIKKKQLEAAEISLASAQEALADVAQNVALKELLVTLNEGRVTDARKALADFQEDLEEARSKNPEIKAPFAGFITSVNVEGGDEVLKGTVAVQLADPEKFEAYIMVSEMDILQVKLDMDAYVQVDAMSGMSLPAKVTHIAPTATIQSGVVNYEVKVEVQSLEAVMQERQAARQQAMANLAEGELPPPLQQAIDEGRLTREQVDEMMKQKQAAMGGQATPAAGQRPTAIPEDFQLREGLTVTVTIIVEEKTDVLLVPNAAITIEGQQSYVQIAMESGETEQRAIETGINNWQFTEITGGLNEGEPVLVPQGTTTTTTTTPQQQPKGGMLFGKPRR